MTGTMLRTYLASAMICALVPAAWPNSTGTWHASSPHEQVHVLELYTSQGCSSCPPADQWLLDLAAKYPDFQTVIPLAFHVTYWDRLGWRDRYAHKSFDARQRALSRRENTGVYTPGMFLNGKEWRGWRRSPPFPRSDVVGVLAFNGGGGSETHFSFTPANEVGASLQLHTAFLQKSVETAVHRGENRGRILSEGYIVQLYRTFRMPCANTCTVSAPLTAPETSDVLVAWLTDAEGNPV